MWTDGSANGHTNFAKDSGLGGGHCCIKAGGSGWRGGLCDSLLHGVCQSEAAQVLAHPGKLIVEGGRGMLGVRWEKNNEGWIPSMLVVRCCFVRYLDRGGSHNRECLTETLLPRAVGVIFKKLEQFSEYNISLTSYLDIFNKTASSSLLGRTCKY